jgi:ABC-type sugar transport system substrate-binding protein
MRKARDLGLKATIMLVSIVALLSFAGIQSAASQSKEFVHGKTAWLLMPYTGEFWWKMLVTLMGNAIKADGWTFNFTTAEGSDTTQADQITTYAQQADLLIVDPTSMTAQNEAIKIAEQQYHCPVLVYKDYITGASRECVQYNDLEAAQAMAKEAVQWIQQKYGTTKGKTVIALNGDLKLSGWKLRADGFRWIKEHHPEINFVETNGGLTPEGWADAAEGCIGGPGSDAVALLSGSDGAYLLGALQALEKYGKLYYVGDPSHVYVASIDGKPSTFMWLRHGYIDTVYPQTPDSIAASMWELAKKYIVKDASYEYAPYTMPSIPAPLTVKQPKGCYWGGLNLTMKVEKVSYTQTPMGTTPSPRIDQKNVNTWELYGNSMVPLIGLDLDPVPTFNAKGTEPAWSAKLLDDYKTWAAGSK